MVGFLLVWKISMQLATMVSRTETQLVSAAKAAMRKNARPTNRPRVGIEAKTLGSEMNIRLGPAFMPSTPSKTKIDGMIMRPARSATPVSKYSIW